MSPSLDDIAGQMRAALAIADPDLDTSVGTTTRKIIDAVAESIGESYLDQHMLTYTYDIDSKMEGDLDSFCQTVGGISRLAGKRASGTVTFTRTGPSDRTIFIPINTQVNSNSIPRVSVQTLSGASMMPGQLSVTVAVQAISAGPGGNLAPYTLTNLATSVEGVSIVSNLQALSGGTFQESDAELRTRWKNTAFRSNAGTEPMYLGMALNDESVTSAVVIGASKKRREQVQIVGRSATSTVPDCAYAFPTNVYLGASIDNGVLLIKDLDYTWDTTTNPPQIHISAGVIDYDTGTINPTTKDPVRSPIEGAILDLEFEYTPTSSRNDPVGSRFGGPSIMSRVDVWCAGVRTKTARQSVVFQSSKRFSSTPGDPLYVGSFANLDGTQPVSNSVFLPLAFGPIVSIPDVLNIGGKSYGRVGASVDPSINYPNSYQVVYDSTAFGSSATSQCGLEWAVASLPADNTVFSIGDAGDYLYNEVPRSVQTQVSRWRLVGVDAQVHAAKQVSLRFNIAVMYSRGADPGTASAIDAAVSLYLSQAGLGGVVQASDIEQVIHNVAGVDNVRLTDTIDYAPTYTYATRNSFGLGVQRIVGGVPVQTYITAGGQPQDLVLADSEVPTLESVVKYVKAQNSFHH